MLRAEVQTGVLGEVGQTVLFFAVQIAEIHCDVVGPCPGKGVEEGPAKTPGQGAGGQLDGGHEILKAFPGQADHQENRAVQAIVVGQLNGFLNLLIAHLPVQDFPPDTLASAFQAKLDDFATGCCQMLGPDLVKDIDMGIDHKGQGCSLFVSSAEVYQIVFVKREEVVIENKRGDIVVVGKQKVDFFNNPGNREVADVIKLAKGTLQIILVILDHMVVKAVGAGEGAASGSHQSHPAVFDINEPLKVKNLIILHGHGGQIGQGTDGIDPGFPIFQVSQIAN